MTPELREEIVVELRRTRAPAKVARALGLDIRDVLTVSDELSVAPRSLRQELHGGEGLPSMRKYLVARKRAHTPWDNTIPEIAAARAAYETGTHTMATGRDGDWLLLYSIPLRRKNPQPDYFKPEV